jgi:DNA-binding CsgD family transcriptional regulator
MTNRYSLGVGMTDREREVMVQLASGASYAEVAKRLGISYQNVKNHAFKARARERVGSNMELFAKLGWLVVTDLEPSETMA